MSPTSSAMERNTHSPDGVAPGPMLSTALPALIALAVAMGIGRFAFTPMLPMMQAEGGLAVAEGGILAAANYLGYLLGALCAAWIRAAPSKLIRGGLAAICVVTAAMAATPEWRVWLGLRFVAGVASALVLVHVSAWSLQRLAAWRARAHAPHEAPRDGALDASQRAARAGGVVFAGVGVGIAMAGLLCLAAMRFAVGSAWSWALLGLVAGAGLVASWRSFAVPDAAPTGAGPASAPQADRRATWISILCYGAFGLGYIVPATFLPAMARQALPDPAWFGWVWPVFGAAAAISTMLAARLVSAWGARRLWAASHALMALGVTFPLIVPGIAGLMVSALLVGGTFMVATMAAMQHARGIAGSRASRLIGAMTASFAAGQVAGPLAVSALTHLPQGGLAVALGSSSALLTLSAIVLLVAGPPRSAPLSPLSERHSP